MGFFNDIKRIADALEKLTTNINNKNATSNRGSDIFKTQKRDEINLPNGILKHHLLKIGVIEATLTKDRPTDIQFDELSLELGRKYNSIKEILLRLKRNATRKNFEIIKHDADGYSNNQVKTNIVVYKKLKELSLLKLFLYEEGHFVLKLNNISEGIAFFTGGWLERYVYVEAVNIQNALSVKAECHKNVKVTYEDGWKNEFDLLIQIQQNRYCFEAKTGEYKHDINTFIDKVKKLQVPLENSYFIVAGIKDDGNERILKDMYGTNFISVDRFANLLRDIFKNYIK